MKSLILATLSVLLAQSSHITPGGEVHSYYVPVGAGIVFVSQATSASGSTTSFVMTAPTSIASGNLLIAGIANELGSGADPITPPSGWSVACPTFSSGTSATTVYYKVAGVSEPSSYTFTVVSSTFFAGSITNFSGANASTPIDLCGTGQGSSSGSPVALSITTTTNNEVVLYYGGADGTGSMAQPSGFTTCGSIPSGAQEGYACGYQAAPAAGATGNQNGTAPPPWTAVLLAIKQ